MTDARSRELVLAKIEDGEIRPTELLDCLSDTLSYQEIQDAVRELLENNEIELGSDRRLRPVSRAA